MSFAENLDFVFKQQKDIFQLSSALALLEWDEKTSMPAGAVNDRAGQTAFFAVLIHEKLVSKKLEQAASLLAESKQFSDVLWEKRAVVERLLKDIEKSKKLPSSFVKKLSITASLSQNAWALAKKKKNFKLFAPFLEKIIALKKEQARLMALPGTAYDSLLDDFEEGMTVKKLDPFFKELKKGELEIIEKVRSSKDYPKKPKKIILSEESQKFLVQKAVNQLLPKGRFVLDTSLHPFTIQISPDDLRITTNYKEGFQASFFAAIHESGHALYELNLPKKFAFTSVFDGASTGLHESQSRFWENMIGKSPGFLKNYHPLVKKLSKSSLSFEEFYNACNSVKPSMIRVQSDELHYPLHVIMRFEIEKQLINESLKVKEIPGLWNSYCIDFFGKKPKDDAEGALQDIHWSDGSIGYFPTYAIGTAYAAQFYAKARKEIKNFDSQVSSLHFEKILEWLSKKVYSHARTIPADEIVKKACGEGLNSRPLLDYFEKKYSKIYNF